MKKLSYEDKVKKSILQDVKLKRIPSRNFIPKPVLSICQMCKKNKVTDHHYLCNTCWKYQNTSKFHNKKTNG